MSSGEKRIHLAPARRLAEEWLATLRPLCTKVDIAGSIRREKPDVGDIEIVALPEVSKSFAFSRLLPRDVRGWLSKPQADRVRLAGRNRQRGLLKEYGMSLAQSLHMPLLIWGAYPGKYLQIALEEGICLDLFMPTPEAWALVYMIRTGSADFSEAMATRSKQLGYIWQEGRVYQRDRGTDKPMGAPIPLETEEAVFEFFQVRWVEPRGRTGREALAAAVIQGA